MEPGDELRDAVFGNERIGHPGLVASQRDLEVAVVTERDERIKADKRLWSRLEKESRRLDRMVYIAVGAGFGGAFGGGWIVALLRGGG